MNQLLIPDLHAPFTHSKALEFVLRVRDRFKTDRTIFKGDMADQYFASRFTLDPGVPNGHWEIPATRKVLQRWYAEFPDADVDEGNHDVRVAKRCAEANIPGEFVRNHNEIWGTPGWKWHTGAWKLDGVLHIHGSGWSGRTAPIRAALEYGCNVCMGHIHKDAGIQYANPKGRRGQLWGFNVGCLIDERKHAFAYGKEDARAGVLGCGVILDGIPIFIPMR